MIGANKVRKWWWTELCRMKQMKMKKMNKKLLKKWMMLQWKVGDYDWSVELVLKKNKQGLIKTTNQAITQLKVNEGDGEFNKQL